MLELFVPHTEPKVYFVTMTPVLAARLLGLNDPRRTAQSDESLIECYVQQMQAGEWPFTGDTYKINQSGGLIDGQHRLQAIMRSGWSGLALVVCGVPDHAAWAMDPPGKKVAA